ncbi:unnamed protein product [Sphagnum jensenii]|uniref:O-fucosyltransferase family protein n=1 Tax=Sphagnum jensenii TaxID=128206 RepID=A0ABP1AC00_9BRYO
MLRQARSQGVKDPSAGTMVRVLWFVGYLTIALGAVLPTFLLPEAWSILHSGHHYLLDVPIMLPKRGDFGAQMSTGELSWRQELLPLHLSQFENLDIHTPQFKVDQKLWKAQPNQGFVPCTEPSPSYAGRLKTRGYLMVSSNGGLNQMRAGICDMVAVARLINATLVVPELDKRSFWQDSSNFSDIFNVGHFIESLKGDVPIVKRLPKALYHYPKVVKQFRSWSSVKYYEEDIVHLWQNHKIIKAAKSDSRLANNNLPLDIQKLRCRVSYDALRFAPKIEAFGKKLVERMRSNGPYIALHLRYEKDMLAFSGCTYGLNKTEALELTTIRQNTPHWRIKKINGTDQRSRGFCPLTPTEVGIFLHALGYPESTRIYIAAGEIYGGYKQMAGLVARFPHLMSKETISTVEELAPFAKHASQMAALDYIVSVESDVFVPSYSGNMARAVEGHRRFLGHRKTISPDRKQLVALYDKLDQGDLQEGPELAILINEIHQKRQGTPRKRKGPLKGTKGWDRFRTEESFYTNPNPECLCVQSQHNKINKKEQKLYKIKEEEE